MPSGAHTDFKLYQWTVNYLFLALGCDERIVIAYRFRWQPVLYKGLTIGLGEHFYNRIKEFFGYNLDFSPDGWAHLENTFGPNYSYRDCTQLCIENTFGLDSAEIWTRLSEGPAWLCVSIFVRADTVLMRVENCALRQHGIHNFGNDILEPLQVEYISDQIESVLYECIRICESNEMHDNPVAVPRFFNHNYNFMEGTGLIQGEATPSLVKTGKFRSTPAGRAHKRYKARCAVCHASPATLFRCSACKTTIYCNRACQMTGWPAHKEECMKGRAPQKPV